MPLRLPLQTGLVYGLLAFAAGFAFGALREAVLIPAFGSSAGHLIEFPLVTATVCAIGAWLARRTALPVSAAIITGLAGTAVLVLIESGFALGVMGTSLGDYLAGYDLLKGNLFGVALVLMALAPAISAALHRR